MTQEQLRNKMLSITSLEQDIVDSYILPIINQHVDEVIGEDTVNDHLNNMLRAEQRKRAGLKD